MRERCRRWLRRHRLTSDSHNLAQTIQHVVHGCQYALGSVYKHYISIRNTIPHLLPQRSLKGRVLIEETLELANIRVLLSSHRHAIVQLVDVARQARMWHGCVNHAFRVSFHGSVTIRDVIKNLM